MLLVLLPTAITYINRGHVGIVIHRIGGGVDRRRAGRACARNEEIASIIGAKKAELHQAGEHAAGGPALGLRY